MKKFILTAAKAVTAVAVMTGAMVLFRLGLHEQINIWMILGIASLAELCYTYAKIFSKRNRNIEY